MSRIIVDATLRAKLNNLANHVELCDELGQTLGHYLPVGRYKELVYAWIRTQGTDDELDRIAREPRGRTLVEIWQRLRNA